MANGAFVRSADLGGPSMLRGARMAASGNAALPRITEAERQLCAERFRHGAAIGRWPRAGCEHDWPVSARLAVNRHIKERKIADAIGEPQSDADCPYMPGEQRALLAHDPALGPSRACWADHGKVRSGHDGFSQPSRPSPSQARRRQCKRTIRMMQRRMAAPSPMQPIASRQHSNVWEPRLKRSDAENMLFQLRSSLHGGSFLPWG
jgi:hypothetical protein